MRDVRAKQPNWEEKMKQLPHPNVHNQQGGYLGPQCPECSVINQHTQYASMQHVRKTCVLITPHESSKDFAAITGMLIIEPQAETVLVDAFRRAAKTFEIGILAKKVCYFNLRPINATTVCGIFRMDKAWHTMNLETLRNLISIMQTFVMRDLGGTHCVSPQF